MMAGIYYRPLVALLQYLMVSATFQSVYSAYLGKFIGKLSELHHGVSGEVYAIDARTLHLKDFTYDGQGPAAYFYAGNSRSPATGGFRLTDENGNHEVIRRYRKENVILTLPEGKTLNNIKWFSVWCEEFTVNFGDVKIPRSFDYPRPRKIDALRGVHGISSDNIVIVDAQTLLVPNFSYDGEAPDAKFWVGRGSKPSPQGVRVPDENGKEEPLRRYDRKTVVLTLPGDLTVFDIGHFGVWCEAFTVDFGHIQVPSNLNVPPSLKMLGVSPQKRPRSFDFSEASKPQVQQLVGGQLEATTYRPFIQFAPQPLILRRNDAPTQQNYYFTNTNLLNQPSQNQIPFYINQPQQTNYNQRLLQQQEQEILQRYIHTPQQINYQQQLQEKIYYSQLSQKNPQEQLNTQYNKFELPNNTNNYASLG